MYILRDSDFFAAAAAAAASAAAAAIPPPDVVSPPRLGDQVEAPTALSRAAEEYDDELDDVNNRKATTRCSSPT